MDVPDALAEQNVQSWRSAAKSFEDNVARLGRQELTPMVELTTYVLTTEKARAFRAGRSMWALVISTKERHGLEQTDPFIAVMVDGVGRLAVEYWALPPKKESRLPWLDGLLMWLLPGRRPLRCVQERAVCQQSDVIPALNAMLQRLWHEAHTP